MNDETRILRSRLASSISGLDRLDTTYASGAQKFLGTVVAPLGSGVSLLPDHYVSVYQTSIDGAEVEGGSVTFGADTSAKILGIVLGVAPVAGDRLVFTSYDGRWIARKRGGTTSIPTMRCNSCDVPLTLSCTWRYRSHNAPGAAGSAVTSITFPVVFDPTVGGWISDYMRISDHHWQTFDGAQSIPIGDWTRVAIYCAPGAGFNLYYAWSASKPVTCPPGPSTFFCPNAGIFRTGVGFDSCSPLHASGFIVQGSMYNEDPDTFFERWDFTA